MQIVIGYPTNKGTEGAEALYVGNDRGEALRILKAGGKGVVRTEIFSHPQPSQRKFHEAKAPQKAAKKAAK